MWERTWGPKGLGLEPCRGSRGSSRIGAVSTGSSPPSWLGGDRGSRGGLSHRIPPVTLSWQKGRCRGSPTVVLRWGPMGDLIKKFAGSHVGACTGTLGPCEPTLVRWAHHRGVLMP